MVFPFTLDFTFFPTESPCRRKYLPLTLQGNERVQDSFDFFQGFIYLFLETGEGGRKREGNINVWFALPHPQLGAWPATQACALTGN